MGNVKIRYYVTHQHPGKPKYGYWSPCLKRGGQPTRMALLGFKIVNCGIDGPEAWRIAEHWNAEWDKVKNGGAATLTPAPLYPPCSLGAGFVAFKATAEWQNSKKKRTHEDWERGWKLIDPIFGDVDPRTLALEDLSLWYSGSADGEIEGLLQTVGVREAHRAMKIWRAMWNVLGTLNNAAGVKYVTGKDPSLGIRRKTPKGRTQVWFEGEVVRLVKGAWRRGYRGLAVALAVAWDTMLSPIDVVKLTAGQRHKQKGAPFQFIQRTKTEVSVIGTISRRTERLLEAYIASLPFELHPDTPIFHTRGAGPVSRPGTAGVRGGDRGGGRPQPPAVYSRDKLGKDLATVRAEVFPGDLRQLIDFRRSGAVEAAAGEVHKGALGAKMGNTIETNPELQATYLPRSGPQTATLVNLADEARTRGRGRIRGGGGSK